MRKKNSLFSKFYIAICFAFFYLPILVTMVFSFNSSKSLSKFTGSGYRYSHRMDAAVLISGIPEGIYDYASGTHCLLYAVCHYQCVSEGEEPGPESGQCGHGPWCHTVSGTDESYSSDDPTGHICRCAAGFYYVF